MNVPAFNVPKPELMRPGGQEATVAGVTYQIEGELGPVLSVRVYAAPIYFEHHLMIWKDPSLKVDVKSLQGAFKRSIHGMPIFVVQTQGSGSVSFSRNGPGHLFALHLKDGEEVDVREHQWVAATESLHYSFVRVSGVSNIVFSGTGMFIDTFACKPGREGLVWIHGFGNVFELDLKEGEQIDVEPGAWIYKDRNLKMETIVQKLSTEFMANDGRLISSRFTGPGRIGLQSDYVHVGAPE